MILYRPIGVKEYILIKESGYKKFPPRLEWQPIFYPVLNQAYAEQIAKEWNTKDEFSGYCGLVTAFEVNEIYIQQFEVKVVGGTMHEELWVPAEELAEFNEMIIGEIKMVSAFFGDQFNIINNSELEIYYNKYQ
ncbi:MAG: ADP-ribosylation/crystallin J1 [Bacteroidota bacterium]